MGLLSPYNVEGKWSSAGAGDQGSCLYICSLVWIRRWQKGDVDVWRSMRVWGRWLSTNVAGV